MFLVRDKIYTDSSLNDKFHCSRGETVHKKPRKILTGIISAIDTLFFILERQRERAGLAICLAICPSTANDRLSRLSLSPLIIDRLIENPRSVSIQQRFGLPSPISSIYTSDLVSEWIVRTVRDRVSHKSR